MGESFITRKGGVAVDTTAAPTITEVSKTDTSITFTVTNNDAESATVYYDFDDEVTSLSEDNVTLATTATSSNIEVTGLTEQTQYTIYSVASAFNKQFSPQTSLAITTDATPLSPGYELLYDSETANNGNPITLPTTQIDITSLNIGKDDTLRLVYTFVGNTTSTTALELRVNDISSNYSFQGLYGTTAVSAERNTLSRIAEARSNRRSQGFADIKVSNNNQFVVQSQSLQLIGSESSSGQIQRNYNVINTSTVSSITKLSIIASAANDIGVGSKIALYKVTEAA